jgi:glutamate carboxypeptidase
VAGLPVAADLVRRLQTWSAINSGSDHLAGLSRMADALATALLELTPEVERVPLDKQGRLALRAIVRPEAPIRILCSGHYDTVFAADSAFQSAQFSADGQRLNGPGVADMKGGIVTMLAALAAFETTTSASNLGWTILLTPDEETGSAASAGVVAATAAGHDLGLVFEPSRETGALVRSRSATAVFTAQLTGRSAHAGRNPEEGRNAVTALAAFCLALEQLPSTIPDTLVNVGNFQGGSTVNIVPDHAVAEINVRAATTTALTQIASEITRLAADLNTRDGYTLEITGGFDRAPLQSTSLTERLFDQLSACAVDLGQPALHWAHVPGGSDGNLLYAAGLPVLDGLGPIGGGLHSDREYIEVASLSSRAQLAATFLQRLATHEIPLS